jgi:putative MATE family efflux protein
MITDKRAKRRIIFSIALPITVQNIVMHLQLLTDRAFLGNVDPLYLAAIGNVMTPYNALTYFFYSVATGLTILIAQNIGRKDFQLAQRIGQTSFIFSSIFSTSLFLMWFFGASRIFSIFGVHGDVLSYSMRFVKIISVSLIFFGLEISMSSMLQAAGKTKFIMMAGVIKSVLNVVLDWVLIYGNFGFPKLGLEGAAIATMTANIVGGIFIFSIVLIRKELPFHLSKKAMLKPKWNLYWMTLKVGMPTGAEALLWYSGQLVLVRLLNQVDQMAIGIYSLVSGIQAIALFLYLGFAKASLTMVGQYWGEEKYQEARGIGLYCQKLAMMVTVAVALILLVFPHFFAQIFSTDKSVIDRAVPLLRLSSLFVLCQVVNLVTGHSIRATGDTRWMLYSQIFGTIFVISLSSFMIFGLSLGLVGMYFVMILDEFFRGTINFIRFYKGVNPFNRLFSKAL